MIPEEWTPRVPMQRIILHWTAGGHKAGPPATDAYHILVEGDGNVVRGAPSIALNSGSLRGGYAAHTRNLNTGSIGLALCCMAGAREYPFDPGQAPMTERQFVKASRVAAELCRRYSIPITEKTVLSHAEVQPTLGVAQAGKWDVTRLPFDPDIKGARGVGHHFRRLVAAARDNLSPQAAPDRMDLGTMPKGAQVRVTASSLNFRRGPTTTHEDVGSLPNGTVVTVMETAPGWLRVKTPAGHFGWVSARFVELVDGPPEAEPTEPDPRRALIQEVRERLDSLEAAL